MSVEFESLVLPEGGQSAAIRDAYVRLVYRDRAGEMLATERGREDADLNARGRYNRTVTKVLPWIQRVFDLRGQRVLEIGSGTGSSGVATARVAGEVMSIEPYERHLAVARLRAEIMGVTNVRFEQALSPQVFDRLGELFPPPLDMVMLSAVLEHQTVEERVETLRRVWESLRPGGVFVVAETPNRLTYRDGHTSGMMFYDVLEEDLALRVFDLSDRAGFVHDMRACMAISWETARDMWVRRGRGVCYYDFDLALPGRPYEILADGYEPEPLAAFGVSYEERLLQSCIAMAGLDVPPVFQRHTMYGIFRKPDPSRAPAAPLRREFSPLVATRRDLRAIREMLESGRQEEAVKRLTALGG